LGKFLNDFLLTLPEAQRKKLAELLEGKQKQGIIKSQTELQAEMERLIKDLDRRNGEPTFQARHQSNQTNSESHNANMSEIEFDLMTLFEVSDQIDRLMADNQQLSRSMLAEIQKKIDVLDARIEQHKLVMSNTDGFTSGIYEQMKSPQYTETDENTLLLLRKDRYGNSLPSDYQAEIVSGSLQLSAIQTVDQLKNPYGTKLARIKVKNRLGKVATNQKHKIEYAIDGSQDTFWAEVILADEPLTHNINEIWSHDYKSVPGDGAICEIEITLNGVTPVSEITIDPYCSYPMEVVAIHGYETTEYGGRVYTLASPNHENPNQRSKKSVDQIVFQFPAVEISKIRMLIRQENYVREHFLVNADETNNMELWDKITRSATLAPDIKEPGESIAEFDKKNEITGWTQYLSALQKWAKEIGDKAKGVVDAAKTAMEVVQTGKYQNPMQLALRAISANQRKSSANVEGVLAQEWMPVSKLVYLYGAYNISITGRKYNQQSIYISKPLPLQSNIKTITLTTEENHHYIELDQGDRAPITDIEYYIGYTKNPDANSWKPILPTNKVYVEGELLIGNSASEQYDELQGTIQFSFRFPVISAETVVLRRNGEPMPGFMYVISDDGKKIGIKREYYSPASIYTVSYKPADEAYFVNIDESKIEPLQFINEKGETGEFFSTVDSNCSVTLSHTPYVFRSQLFRYNSETERYEQDNSRLQADDLYYPVIVRVNGEEYRNITDYTTGTYDREKLQTANGGKVFAQVGNKIFFPNTTSDKLANITVDYFYLTTDVRLKAILRRNHAGYESVTPALYSYTLRCQSYDQEASNG